MTALTSEATALTLGYTSSAVISSESPQTSTIPQGPWIYLTDGTQSKVYEHGDLVLKVMKTPSEVIAKYKEYGVEDISTMRWVKEQHPELAGKQVATAQMITARNITSYLKAWDFFRNETELCQMHVSPTEEGIVAQLQNRSGEISVIALSKTPFYIQRKAKLLETELVELVDKRLMEEAKQVLDLWISAQEVFWNKGFYDYDVMAPHKNYGLSAGKIEKKRVVCLDIGELHKDSKLISELEQKRVLADRMEFSKFLKKLDLFDYFKEQVDKRYDAFRERLSK